MFEKASKLKLRFSSDKGLLSVEDLWDLPLAQLNVIAKKVNKQLALAKEEDFLEESSKEDTEVKLAFDIVLYIIKVKKEEAQRRIDSAEKKAKRTKLMELLAKKQDASLEQLSEEELLKQLNELD